MSDSGFFSPTGVTKFDGQSLVAGENGNIRVYDVTNAAVLATGATTARTLGAMAGDNPTGATFNVLPDATGALAAANTTNFQTALSNSVRLVIPANLAFETSGQVSMPSVGRLTIDGNVKMAASSNSSLLFVGANTLVDGLGILDGNKANNPSSPANVGLIQNTTNTSNITVRDLTLQNAFGWTFNMGGYNGTIVSRIVFDNVSSIGSNDAPEFFNTTASGFWRGYIADGSDYGLTLYGGVTFSYVCDTYFINSTGAAATGVYADSGSLSPCNADIFSRNIINGCGQGVSHAVYTGITTPHTNIVTTTNLITGATIRAIDIAGVAGGDVTANYIYGPTTVGSVIQGISSGVRYNGNRHRELNGPALTYTGSIGSLLIDGNYFDDDQTTPTMTTGIAATADPSPLPILGLNYFGPSISTPVAPAATSFQSIFGFYGQTAPAVPTFHQSTTKTTGFANVGLSLFDNAGQTHYVNGNEGGGGGHIFRNADSNGNLLPINFSVLPTGNVKTTADLEQTYASANPASGSTFTVPAGQRFAVVDLSASLAALTIGTLPVPPVGSLGASAELSIIFSEAVTTLTWPTGIVGAALPSSAMAGTIVNLIYVGVLAAWVHVVAA